MTSITRRLKLAYRRLRTAVRPDIHVSEVPSTVHVDWNVPVTVRDGTVLRVNVFRPMGQTKVPVIMSAHPYHKDLIPANTRSGRGLSPQYRLFPQPDPITFSKWTGWEAPDPAVWVPKGYVVINADLRGAGKSDGVGELLSEQESRDYYDLIEWAGTQPWCSGRVGLDGVSYLAISQYGAAALHPPHLAAICPWEGFSDLYRDFTHPGGVREDGFSIVWNRGMKRAGRFPVSIRDEIVARPDLDTWYEAHTPQIEKIEVPMLVCASFSDQSLHTRGSFELFRRAASKQKWVYTHRGGKWSTYYSPAATEVRSRFFEYFLKGIDNGWADEPRVRLAVHDAGPSPVSVFAEDQWPPHDVLWGKLWLNIDGRRMQIDKLTTPPGAASFHLRRGKLSFCWTVPDDLDLIGTLRLRLHVELQGMEDAFLFAGLRKFRDGREVMLEGSFGFAGDMVTKGWQRIAHREIDSKLSLPEMPVHTHAATEPLHSGEIVPVEIALLPQATRFLKGDVLQLDISGKWHYARNPLTGQFPTWYERSPKGLCTLHTGGPHDAHLLAGMRSLLKDNIGETDNFRSL